MSINTIVHLWDDFDSVFIAVDGKERNVIRNFMASLLKYGYGVNYGNPAIIVVNLPDEDEFITHIDSLCKYYNCKYISSMRHKDTEECCLDCSSRQQKRQEIIKAFHLQTYKELQRGARWCITIIHEYYLQNERLETSGL